MPGYIPVVGLLGVSFVGGPPQHHEDRVERIHPHVLERCRCVYLGHRLAPWRCVGYQYTRRYAGTSLPTKNHLPLRFFLACSSSGPGAPFRYAFAGVSATYVDYSTREQQLSYCLHPLPPASEPKPSTPGEKKQHGRSDFHYC